MLDKERVHQENSDGRIRSPIQTFHNPDSATLQALIDTAGTNYYESQYDAAITEAEVLLEQLSFFRGKTPEQISESVVHVLQNKLAQAPQFEQYKGQLSHERIAAIFDNNDIFSDISSLVHSLEAELELKDHNQYYILYHETGHLYKYISNELHNTLRLSRCLGIIPFELLNKLANKKIVILGASAVLPLIEALNSMGAATGDQGWMRIIDGGSAKVNFGAKAVGTPSHFYNIGRSKVEPLYEDLVGAQPYGHFDVYSNFVSVDNNSGLPLDTFVGDADICIEVVDDPVVKMSVKRLQESRPNLVILRIADTGLEPVISIEASGSEYTLGRTPSQAEVAFLNNYVQMDGPTQKQLAPLAHLIIAQSYLSQTPEHAVSFLANPSFLSQTGITSRSASVLGIIEILRGIKYGFADGLHTASSVNTKLIEVDAESLRTLEIVLALLTRGVSKFRFS